MSAPKPTSDPTADLLVRARNGDQPAWDELFARAAPRLQMYLRVRLGAALRQHEDSLDLLQETFLAAHAALADFEDRGDGAFVRWLCRITENCIRARADHHGAKKRRPPGELQRVSQVMERLAAGTMGPMTRADRADRREQLGTAMAGLPRDEREAMLMRHFEGLDIDAIAARLGLSATSTRRLLGRATFRIGIALGVAPDADDREQAS